MKISLKKHIYMALLLCMSIVLSFVKLPIIPIAPFLTLDLSDVPLFVNFIMFGFSSTVYLILLKSLFLWLLEGFSIMTLVGVLINMSFILCLFILLYYLRHQRTYISYMISIILTVGIMMLLNRYVFLPMYMTLFHLTFSFSLTMLVWGAILPFNLIKSSLLLAIYQFLNKHLQSHFNVLK